MKRVVKLKDTTTETIISCRILSKMPAEGSTISGVRIDRIREIYVGVVEGEFRFQTPYEWPDFEGFKFFKAQPEEESGDIAKKAMYFCVKARYNVVCVFEEAGDTWLDLIDDCCRVLTPEELKEKYSDALALDDVIALQVLDEDDHVVSEYRAEV